MNSIKQVDAATHRTAPQTRGFFARPGEALNSEQFLRISSVSFPGLGRTLTRPMLAKQRRQTIWGASLGTDITRSV